MNRNASALSRRVLVLCVKVITLGDTFHNNISSRSDLCRGGWGWQSSCSIGIILKSKKMCLSTGSQAFTTPCLHLVTFSFQIQPNNSQDLETHPTFGSEGVGLASCPSRAGRALTSHPSQAEFPLFVVTQPGSRSGVRSKGPGTNALVDPALNHPTLKTWGPSGNGVLKCVT